MDTSKSSHFDCFTIGFEEGARRSLSTSPLGPEAGPSTTKRSAFRDDPSSASPVEFSKEYSSEPGEDEHTAGNRGTSNYDSDDGVNVTDPTIPLKKGLKVTSEDQNATQKREVFFRKHGEGEAARRPITAEWDEVDQMIVDLKDKGWRNPEVVAEIKKATKGAVDYSVKTVGTRYTRLKQAQTTEADRLLDDELTDWHEGEDEALLEADAASLAELYAEIQRKKDRRWETTAKLLQRKLKKPVPYSAKSCEKRFVALHTDTARIPPELDDNPERRAAEKAEKELARLKRKQKAEAEKVRAKEKKRLLVNQKRVKQIEDQKARLELRAKLIEARAQEAYEKADKSAAIIEANQHASEESDSGLPELQRGVNAGKSKSESFATSASSKSNPLAAAQSFNSAGTAQEIPLPPGVTNFRVKLTVEELQDHCEARGLPKGGKKAALVDRLAKDDAGLSDAALTMFLMERDFPAGGTREERLARLAMADAAQSKWGKKHSGQIHPKGKATQYATRVLACQDETDDSEPPPPKRTRTRSPALTEGEIAAHGDEMYEDSAGDDVQTEDAKPKDMKASLGGPTYSYAFQGDVKTEDAELKDSKAGLGGPTYGYAVQSNFKTEDAKPKDSKAGLGDPTYGNAFQEIVKTEDTKPKDSKASLGGPTYGHAFQGDVKMAAKRANIKTESVKVKQERAATDDANDADDEKPSVRKGLRHRVFVQSSSESEDEAE